MWALVPCNKESKPWTGDTGPSVPEPEKYWHIRQQITDAKWKRGKYIVKGIDDIGDKY